MSVRDFEPVIEFATHYLLVTLALLFCAFFIRIRGLKYCLIAVLIPFALLGLVGLILGMSVR